MATKIFIVLLSYFIGNISTSVIVSKLWANIDIRNYGSGNAGTTNVLRTLGVKAALITLIGDILKGWIAVWLGKKVGGIDLALFCGVAVIVGHNWPALFGFKGGKGIATAIGVIMQIQPLVGLICIAVGILTIIKTKYVSLGSLLGICLSPFLLWVFVDWKHFLFACVLAALALFRHRSNIKRLMQGTESKIQLKKSGLKQ
ncbi:MAG TPA: glycerol-3-phosphate 1-O-acyltransferase PlsY [Clostridiales bacterium]|nr:glycerol-3-phosphate 1-O-acyltransferase PlsY [Clostridiales bacterium]